MILTRRAGLGLGLGWGFAALGGILPAALPRQAAAEQLHKLAEAVPVDPPRPFDAPSLHSLEGQDFDLRPLRGRIVVLNFWATWCPPCVAEMPALDRLAAANPDMAVLAASSDRGGAQTVRPFLASRQVSHLTPLLDPKGAGGRSLGVAGFPTTLLIDRAMRLRAVMSGPVAWDSEAAEIRRLTA